MNGYVYARLHVQLNLHFICNALYIFSYVSNFINITTMFVPHQSTNEILKRFI